MKTTSFEICFTCGSIKSAGKICKSCTTYVKTPERKNYIKKQAVLTKINKQKSKSIQSKSIQANLSKSQRKAIRYSENRGLEWDIDISPPTGRRTRANTCIKCKKLKAEWEGVWVKAGGPYASDNPEIRTKRVFLCGQCWSPTKKSK